MTHLRVQGGVQQEHEACKIGVRINSGCWAEGVLTRSGVDQEQKALETGSFKEGSGGEATSSGTYRRVVLQGAKEGPGGKGTCSGVACTVGR